MRMRAGILPDSMSPSS